MVEDWNNFLTKIKNLKLYIIEFEEDKKMKSKVYLFDCKVGGNN